MQLVHIQPAIQYETKVNSNCILEEFTGDDWASRKSRENLDRLEFDREMFCASVSLAVHNRFDEKRREFGRKRGEDSNFFDIAQHYEVLSPAVYNVAKIVNSKGRIFRDRTRRLQSPFPQLKSELRACCTFEGKPLEAIDLRAAQPTLLAHETADEKLKNDCVSDQLYTKIADALNCSREEAKQAYCHFAYGGNRTKETPENSPAFKVQLLFKQEYPKTADHIWKAKENTDFRQFFRRMMWLESRVFIDGVFRELCKQGIYCLTVHDGVYFQSDQPKIVNVIENALAEKMR